ncbi:MAG: lysoplasmalogenase [Clostridium sp.]|uniref:lysoplasmalogenase n=1 Tax=Clostridium sp. TaxID=1506 RepID=UPI00303BCD99
MLPFIFFALMLVSLGLLIHFSNNPKGHLKHIFKTTTSVLFILIAISSYGISQTNSKYFTFILLALIMSLSGDVFLAFTNRNISIANKPFIFGVGSFSIAHIFFSIAFIVLVPISLTHMILFVVLSIISIIVLKSVKGFNFKGTLPMVAAYSVIISFMVSRAFAVLPLFQTNNIGTILIAVGTTLFFLSDLILSFVYFYKDCPSYMSTLNLITYYVGQGLIALSLISKFAV